MYSSQAVGRILPGSVLILLAVGLAACSGPRQAADLPSDLPAGFPNHTAPQIRRFILGGEDSVQAFRARASFSLDSPEQSGRFSSEIRARRDDSLLITVSPGLGIEAARALVTPDSLFIYDRLRNEITYGAVEDAGSPLGVPLGEENLFGNLLGIFFPDASGTWQVTSTDTTYILTDPATRRRLVVSPSVWRVLRYEERSPDGDLVEERVYSDFTGIEGVYLPRRVLFRRPQEETTASLYYRELEVNPSGLSFPLRASASADRVPLPASR